MILSGAANCAIIGKIFSDRVIFLEDEIFMREALRIAENARGRTSPNPLVGAVIVKDGRIVAEGWHRKAGTPHAEIHALNQAGELARNSTIYVTLEPCSHFGRTPPCANALVKAGIKRAVVAVTDPNPKVAGRGIKILRDAGIEVEVGILEENAKKLNEVFFKYIVTGLPFVTSKFACSLDGKIATTSGESFGISSPESLKFTHRLRDINDAIMVGIGTVLNDNPSLTTRLETPGKNPTRIIVDGFAKTPQNSKILTDGAAKDIFAVTPDAPAENIAKLKNTGAEIIFSGEGGKVDLKFLMRELAKREITSILVEGGGTLHFSLFKENLVDKVHAFIAPKIIGGKDAVTGVDGEGFAKLSDAVRLKNLTSENLGSDILITGYVE